MPEESKDNEPDAAEHVFDRDPLLQLIVEIVSRIKGMSIGVTLTVGGAIVSGEIIGADAYFEALGEQWKEGLGGGQHGEEVGASIAGFGKQDTSEPEDQDTSPKRQFIHLRNARLFVGSQFIPTGSGMLLRVRLTQVDGFSMSQITDKPKR